jgi:hypothetical protein
MTISSFKVEEMRELKNWFKLTFKSEKNGVGDTSIEMLVSAEALRFMMIEIARALGEKPDYSKLPDKLRKFMEDRE